MSRRQRLDWAICTVVLMLAYAGRGWLLATLLQGHYPWKALLVDVTALALLVSTFRLFDLGLRAFCQCMVTRWRTPRTLEQTDAKPPLLLSTNWQRAANSAVGTKGTGTKGTVYPDAYGQAACGKNGCWPVLFPQSYGTTGDAYTVPLTPSP